MSNRTLGILLAVMAAGFASSAGLLLRLVEVADGWTILVYRSAGFVAAVLFFVVARHGRQTGRRFLETGVAGVVVALSLGGAFIAFLLALLASNVATVVAVLSVSPMAAGLIGWVFLGEKPAGLAWLAMLLAGIGVCVVIWDGLAAESMAGLALAGVACLGYSGAIVGLRAGRSVDMSPAICLSGMVAGVVSIAMAPTFMAPLGDIGIGLALGTVQIGAQYILLTVAARYISAGEIAMVMILEVILAPIWVWLFVGEVIPMAVVFGGPVIILALALNAVARPSVPRLAER